MAFGSSLRGTASATVEFHAGDNIAVQAPAMKMKNSSVAGPPMPANSSSASSVPAATCAASAPSISRRRSVMSASTPAGSDSRNIGRNTAVCTSADRNDEPVNSIIIQAAAIVCIALAMKYRPPPSHSARKPGWRSADQVESGAGDALIGGDCRRGRGRCDTRALTSIGGGPPWKFVIR